MNLSPREDFGAFENEGGDALGFQFRIGYHPRRSRLRSAASPATAATTTASGASESTAHRGGAMRAVHG